MKMAHRPIPPNDVEYYIDKTRAKASQSGRELSKIKEMRNDMVEDTYAEIEKLRAQKILDDVKRGVATNTGQNPVYTSLFQGKTPEQINEILQKMTPDAIERLHQLASRVDGSNAVNATFQPQAPQKTETQMLIEAIKLVKEIQQPQAQQGNSAKEIVDALTAGIKLANESRPPAPPPQQAGPNPVELIKLGADLQRPGIDAVNAKDRQILDLKLKEIESRIPQDPLETIKYAKEVAGTLGLSNGAKSEIDLRLAEMKQNENLEMTKIDWEKEKYKMDAENELSKYEFLGKIFEGPVGKAIQSIGNAGADRVRPHGNPNMPKPVQTQCPNCQKIIYVDADAATAICGNCGAQLQKQAEPPPQPAPQQEPTHVADNPSPQQAAEPEQEKEQEGEETDELRGEGEEPEQQ